MVLGMDINDRDSAKRDVADFLAGRGSLGFTIALGLLGLVFVISIVAGLFS